MYKFSLYEDAKNLKIKLKTCIFFGESSWTKSANICKGDIIPILMRDKNGRRYLHSMKWGTNLFSHDTKNVKQLQNQARDDKVFSRNNKNNNNNPWVELVANGQRCVIVAKGFYINNYTEVYNVKYRTKQTDKQTYFVTPYVASEGEFFYVAALYRVQQLNRQTKKYGAVAITKSTKGDDEFKKYNQRMPYLLRPKDIDQWLNAKVSIKNIYSLKYKITYNEFMKIGLWINNDLIKDENKILRSKTEWEFENNAKIAEMEEDDFPWDKIEEEALRQNEAKKHGMHYQPTAHWDKLEQKKMNNNNNETDYNLDDDRELKQEEYTQTDDNVNTNKNNNDRTARKRPRNNNDKNAENVTPLTIKKRKIDQKKNGNGRRSILF